MSTTNANTDQHNSDQHNTDQHNNVKILVFGATGTTGSEVVKRALELGHAVTAFVRTPAKVELQHPNLTIAQGDALDPASVERAVSGHDVVLCSLGDGAQGKVRAEGTRNIIRAMEKSGPRRLIVQSSMGVGDSEGNLNFFWKYIMFGMLLRKAHADTGRQEEYVQQSNLDWIIIRPGALTDGERSGQYRHGFPGADKSTKLKIARADVADFMLKQMHDDTYLHATPALSY